ncbi:MAG: MotA/TolQ/ExbB proton channel family protein [Victivallaceae bacterium]
MDFCGIVAALGATEGAFYAFDVSDAMGQGIVLLLLAGSIATWTIMLDKYLELHRARKLSEKFLFDFRKAECITAPRLLSNAVHDPGPVARVYAAGASTLLEFYGSRDGEPVPAKLLTTAQREAIRTVLDNEVSDQILVLEQRVPFLALAVSVSPFCGLFGTVWGVMLAFCGAAKVGRADIAAIAPGVAGALLTTVVGLVVAIPSLVGYNILTGSIRKNTVYMDNFVEEFMTRLGLEQLEFEKPAAPEPVPAPAPGLPHNYSAYEAAQVVMPLKSMLNVAPQPFQPQSNTGMVAQSGISTQASSQPFQAQANIGIPAPGAVQPPTAPVMPESPLKPRSDYSVNYQRQGEMPLDGEKQ